MMPLQIEFFSYNSELWFRRPDGTAKRLSESDAEIVTSLLNYIEEFYPEAYVALCKEYERCSRNLPLYRFRMVKRFCMCNFGNIDKIDDIDCGGRLHLECVPCPLRGECRLEEIICSPKFNSHISDAEKRVLKLWYNGQSKEEIADTLYLSIFTVNNHIRNAFARINVHSKAEFFQWAQTNSIFD